MNAQPTTVLGSAVHMLHSQHTGRDYRITVYLPLGYAAAPGEPWPFHNTPARWPTVYVLDGNWYDGMVAGMIRPTAWCGSITDAIVVGIGYPEDGGPIAAFRESFTRRNADLTPTRDEPEEARMAAAHGRHAPTGDAGNFLNFMQHELIPLVEQEYRANPSLRILVGHSYGGLFGLFCLFETPGLFQTLILGSPTLSYGDRFLFQLEQAFATKHTHLPAQVYLFAAELEEAIDDTTLTDTLRLAAILQGRRYAGFSLLTRIFRDQNHCEVAAPGFQWGLKFALKS